jgi:hypothetical protein
MICREFGCIFVHIPKTAGQSIEHFFLNLLGMTWQERAPLLLRYNADPKLGPERLAHLTASEYVNCGYLNRVEYASYYKFTFVRNPWDRLVSEYKYRNYGRSWGFKEFVKKHLPAPGMSDAYRHIMPQYEFIYDESGNLLVDFVGQFENLQSGFDLVCKEIGVGSRKLPHMNASTTPADLMSGRPRSHYTSFYDSEARALVSEMYAKDIELFNYKYGQ